MSSPGEPAVDLELAASHGLTAEEYERLVALLGRTPSLTELGITAALWSEHCSYKSSRAYLREFPTSGPRVLQGPGENAGIVDIGHGWVAVFKIESHNHPSYIEPYQGAATGVGGILRDVFTMGARPIACMDSLRFGDLEAPRMRSLVDGVVRGVGDYGNCVGIPTVASSPSTARPRSMASSVMRPCSMPPRPRNTARSSLCSTCSPPASLRSAISRQKVLVPRSRIAMGMCSCVHLPMHPCCLTTDN